MLLTREVRMEVAVLNGQFRFDSHRIRNSWTGHTANHSLAATLAVRATVAGIPATTTGYVDDIRAINAAVLQATEVVLQGMDAATLMPDVLRAIYDEFSASCAGESRLVAMEVKTTPYTTYRIETEHLSMILITQQFEFSAAHRLHSTALSDEENRRVYGKCNHISGHGHNYRVDVTVRCQHSSDTPLLDMGKLEELIKRRTIDRFDHKHLDLDCEEFAHVPSTVENIAVAIWNQLNGQLSPATLYNVRVYETPKTWADVGEHGG